MADVQEPRYATLAERIAALNQQKNFQAPSPGVKAKRAPPPPPPAGRPAGQIRSQTSPVPAPNPALPTRPVTKPAPPSLPRRTTIAVDGDGGDEGETATAAEPLSGPAPAADSEVYTTACPASADLGAPELSRV